MEAEPRNGKDIYLRACKGQREAGLRRYQLLGVVYTHIPVRLVTWACVCALLNLCWDGYSSRKGHSS